MKSVDELDGEIRRALSELGDAAGLAPRFDQLGHRPGASPGAKRQPRVLATLGVAALVAGLIALALVRSDAPDSSAGAEVAATVPAATSALPPTSLSPTAPEPPSPLFERPPIRFMAMASVSCASALIDP